MVNLGYWSRPFILESYLTVNSLDSNLNAGYAIAVKNADNSYETIVGKGTLYMAWGMLYSEPLSFP